MDGVLFLLNLYCIYAFSIITQKHTYALFKLKFISKWLQKKRKRHEDIIANHSKRFDLFKHKQRCKRKKLCCLLLLRFVVWQFYAYQIFSLQQSIFFIFVYDLLYVFHVYKTASKWIIFKRNCLTNTQNDHFRLLHFCLISFKELATK